MMGPLCKVCGKPVPKHIVWKTWHYKDETAPRSKEEARTRSNHQLVTAKLDNSSAIGPFVQFASYWDGTYIWGGHFHAQACAAQFGQSMADHFPDYAMPAYRAAMAQRAAKEGATNG